MEVSPGRRALRAMRPALVASRPASIISASMVLRLYPDTDKALHGYGEFYARHLAPRRLKRRRILEIGVGGYANRSAGGSLRYWRDFFPRAAVVGLDIHDKDVNLGGRVRFVCGDQTSPADLDRSTEALGGPPEIVIDDGSHIGEHIWASFEHLFPRMAPGSIYVVEDLHTSYWEGFGGSIPAAADSGVGLIQQSVSEVQVSDPTFWRGSQWRPAPPPWDHGSVAAVHAYPGIAFIVRGEERDRLNAASSSPANKGFR